MKKQLTICLALLILLCTSAYAQLPSYLPADGLVGWWPFNGNANDESGNGNDGVVNGALLAEDRFGSAMASINQQSDGSYIRTQNVLANISNSFTISFWANPSVDDTLKNQGVSGSEGTAYNSVIHPPHGSNWGSASSNAGVGINVGQNQIQVVEHSHLYIASPLVYVGQIMGWHHIALIYDNHTPKLYVDGLLVATGLVSSRQNVRPGNGYCSIYSQSGFGRSFAPNGNPVGNFKGDYDDIGIWNRALTDQEILEMYTIANIDGALDTGDGAAPLPQGIPYQAAARDGNGQPVVDSPVNVRFSLREGAADGATSYIESHSLTTNSIGLFNTVFGNGTPVQSAFDSINWAATTKFLQVEIDLGSGYVDMGTTQLLSVPYAFRSSQAATLKNAALPIYPDNTAALAGGLMAGEMYRTATGDLKVVY
jgi:hypothetical protein